MLGRLHVSGNKIVNGQGQQVWLKGAGYSAKHWLWGQNGCPQNEAQFQYMKDWGFTAVRLVLPIKYQEFSTYATKLDQQIEWATKNGMYSILCFMHGAPAYLGSNYDWTKARNEWLKAATRYKDNPYVMYEIFNEAVGISALDYQREMETIIDTILSVDPDSICFVQAVTEDPNGWYDIGLNFQIDRPNIVYVFHHYYQYDSQPFDENSVRSYLRSIGVYSALNRGIPVLCGEFNFNHVSGQSITAPVNGPKFMKSMMTVCDEDGLSGFWAWWWHANFNYHALLSDWSGNPTSSGIALQEYLITSQPPPPPAEEPLPPPPPLTPEVPASRTLVAQALPFPLLIAKLWRLRTRFIREDIHRKVHPFI